jgi:phosphopantothenate synthetase
MLTKNHTKLISRCNEIIECVNQLNEAIKPIKKVVKNPHDKQRFIYNYLKSLRERLESLSKALAQANIAYYYHGTKKPLE